MVKCEYLMCVKNNCILSVLHTKIIYFVVVFKTIQSYVEPASVHFVPIESNPLSSIQVASGHTCASTESRPYDSVM